MPPSYGTVFLGILSVAPVPLSLLWKPIFSNDILPLIIIIIIIIIIIKKISKNNNSLLKYSTQIAIYKLKVYKKEL